MPFERLPLNTVPIHYDLEIKPSIQDFTFEGIACIEMKVNECSCQITLNAAELVVDHVVWIHSARSQQEAASFAEDKEAERLVVDFDPPIPEGEGTLIVCYTGSINDKMKGFYRSKIIGPDGEERFNCVTQFQPTDARRAFPCYDEPAHKATFDITLIADKKKTVLSNMPVAAQDDDETDCDLSVYYFARTPKMSTYLVAWVIGDFEFIETISADGVKVRVYTPLGKKDQGSFALSVCAKVLPYYNEYFGIAYPLPKIDMMAIANFSAGAMENWGLVTYRETALLVDDKTSSALSRQYVAVVVGHEVAHQWFGNLVTMEWWTHLWLNEGFASFVENLCVDHLFPDYDIWTQFHAPFSATLKLDALRNSHPIEIPVGHPSEIAEIFDDISYIKGGSIIRMLSHYMGDADFKKGMNLYLTRHQYQNTFTEQLWDALGEASGKPIAQIMDTWTKQMGYPLVRVEELPSNDPGSRKLVLSQEKFWVDQEMKNTAEHAKYSWKIPVAFSTPSSQSTGEFLLEDKTKEVNPGSFGFYRVWYSPNLLKEFLPAIKDKSLPPMDRVSILDDSFAMVRCGESSTVDVLYLLDSFENEDHFIVWLNISTVMMKLNLLLAYTESHDKFLKFGQQLFRGVGAKVGWEPVEEENHLATLLRSLVLHQLVSFGHEETLQECKRRLPPHISGEKPIIPDLRSAVYKGVMSAGDMSTYETLTKMYRDTTDMTEKVRIGQCLGSSQNAEVLKKVLQFSISDDVRSQDTLSVLGNVARNKVGRPLAWQFFKDNTALFKERYPGDASGASMPRLIEAVTENFVTEEMAKEVEEYFKQHEFLGTERTVQQCLESIRVNSAWLGRDGEAIAQFFNK